MWKIMAGSEGEEGVGVGGICVISAGFLYLPAVVISSPTFGGTVPV